MGLTATLIAVRCIHLAFLMILAAATSCPAGGDCSSKHAAVFPTTEPANPKHNAPATKDVHYERSGSKENSMARKSKGLPYTSTTAMERQKTMAATKSKLSSRPVNAGRSDYHYRSHGDYDSYDPAPALVKPPFKLIPN